MLDQALVNGLESIQAVAAFAASGTAFSRVALAMPQHPGERRLIRAAAAVSAAAGLALVAYLIVHVPGGGPDAVFGALFGSPALAGLMVQLATCVSLAVDPGRSRVASLMAIILATSFGLTEAVPAPQALDVVIAALQFPMAAGAVGAFCLFLLHADDPDLPDYVTRFTYIAFPSACALGVAEALVFVGLLGLIPAAADAYMPWVFAKLRLLLAVIGVVVWCHLALVPRLKTNLSGRMLRLELALLLAILVSASVLSRSGAGFTFPG